MSSWTRGGNGILRRGSVTSLALSLSLTRSHSSKLFRDDLDLVEGVAETVGSSVQLEFARRLESVRGLGGPLLGSGLPRGSRSILVVVVLRSDRSWSWGRLVMVVVLNRSWLVNWSRGWGRLTGRVLRAESWVVPARIVLSIVVSLVVIATATAAELGLVLRFRLVLSLRLVLGLRSRSSCMWWRSWGYWQMVTRGLESTKKNLSL